MFWQKLGLNGRVKWEDLSEGLQPNTFLYAKDTVEMKQGKGGRGNRGDQQVVRGGGGGRGRGAAGRGGGRSDSNLYIFLPKTP